jgi:hypothetical protein
MLLNESRKWSPDAVEAELAHVGADEVRLQEVSARTWAIGFTPDRPPQ